MNKMYTQAPHQTAERGPSPNAALLIDFDNVTMGIRSNLGQELTRLLNSDIIRGKVSVQRAYADWRRYPQYVVPLSEASIDLIYAPAYGSSKKNATDIRLAIDALEIVFTRPEIGTYILMSGDSDFSSLVLKLKEYGKYVIGVGMQESSSDLLVQNCDEYYSYTRLSGLVSAEDMTTERHDPWELAERSVERMEERSDVMRSDRMKQVMLELDPSFDEKELGFSKFNRFLVEAASRGILRLRRIGNGQYEVASVSGSGGADQDAGGGASQAPAQQTSAQPKASGSGGDGRQRQRQPEASSAGSDGGAGDVDSLRAAYDFLREVVRDLAEPDQPVRDSEVKRRMLERRSSFDEATLGFSKFSRFLRQAHDEGVVNLIKGDEGNYFLEPADGTSSKKKAKPSPSRPAAVPSAPRSESSDGGGDHGDDGKDAERAAADEEESEEPARAERREAPSASRLTRGRRGRRGGRRGASGGAPSGEPAGASGAGGAESTTPEPVSETDDADSGDAVSEDSGSGDAGSAEPASTRGQEPSTAAPRGVGRFRRGRRGGAGARKPSKAQPDLAGNVAGDSGDAAGADDGDEAGDASESRGAPGAPDATPAGEAGDGGHADDSDDRKPELVAHMSENYPGVGRRTAEALVEEFGLRVFDVIDHQPERVEELLPSHRAEAVLSARAEERQASPAGDGR